MSAVLDLRCHCWRCELQSSETYGMAWKCTNCGTAGDAIVRKGDRPDSGKACPNCGVASLQYSPPNGREQ